MVYFFMFLMLIQCFFILYLKDTVISVLFLILVFLLSSMLFLMLGAEFLSILLMIVYVGAVSVLFLFIIMLLNLSILEVYHSVIYYLPLGLFILSFFFLELIFMLFKDLSFLTVSYSLDSFWVNTIEYKNNLILIAELLYNYYNYYLMIASLILLLGMVGVMALTLDFFFKKPSSLSITENKINSKIIFWMYNK